MTLANLINQLNEVLSNNPNLADEEVIIYSIESGNRQSILNVDDTIDGCIELNIAN